MTLFRKNVCAVIGLQLEKSSYIFYNVIGYCLVFEFG